MKYNQKTLDSARRKMGIGGAIASAWESYIGKHAEDDIFNQYWLMEKLEEHEPDVIVTSPQILTAYQNLLCDDPRSTGRIKDIQRAEYTFWRAQHPNPEMWTDSPVESAVDKDSLMAELEKKLTGRQT